MSDLAFTTRIEDFEAFDGHTGPGVYAFVTDEDEVVYVGQTNSLSRRISEHLRERPAVRGCRKLVSRVADSDTRLELETCMILRYRPTQNRAILVGLRRTGRLYQMQLPRRRKAK